MQERELLLYRSLQEDLVAHFLTYLSVVSTYLPAIHRLVFWLTLSTGLTGGPPCEVSSRPRRLSARQTWKFHHFQHEENSEVNRFVGWSLFSLMKKFSDKDEDVDCVKLLSSMIFRERQMDDEYLNKY